MPRELIDLLWRAHPHAPRDGSRGPKAKVTTSRTVDCAIDLADAEGLESLTVRKLASELGISPMAVYTHIGTRTDLLVLMADAVRAGQRRDPYVTDDWQARVEQIAEADLALYTRHWWLIDVTDQRSALGPGTIAKYDHELHAFDGTNLDDVERDAALTFVTDFTRTAAQARRPDPHAADMADVWYLWNERLKTYLGEDFPLAQRVGAAAGESMNAPYSPDAAWTFGLARVVDALESLVNTQS
ncbi:AcrR family transcriptional regulator [Rhodococcus sp. 27YEA15]|uniref:TetR/AcrR family transcriptional regulator n=1 Tax=Rhodococcus sp. 27YEA15 TaxID=3156259 RepID=UPI003C7CB89C